MNKSIHQRLRDLIEELEHIEFNANNIEYISDLESVIDDLECQSGTIATILEQARNIDV